MVVDGMCMVAAFIMVAGDMVTAVGRMSRIVGVMEEADMAEGEDILAAMVVVEEAGTRVVEEGGIGRVPQSC